MALVGRFNQPLLCHSALLLSSLAQLIPALTAIVQTTYYHLAAVGKILNYGLRTNAQVQIHLQTLT